MKPSLLRYVASVFDGTSKSNDVELLAYSWRDAFDMAKGRWGSKVNAHDIRPHGVTTWDPGHLDEDEQARSAAPETTVDRCSCAGEGACKWCRTHCGSCGVLIAKSDEGLCAACKEEKPVAEAGTGEPSHRWKPYGDGERICKLCGRIDGATRAWDLPCVAQEPTDDELHDLFIAALEGTGVDDRPGIRALFNAGREYENAKFRRLGYLALNEKKEEPAKGGAPVEHDWRTVRFSVWACHNCHEFYERKDDETGPHGKRPVGPCFGQAKGGAG